MYPKGSSLKDRIEPTLKYYLKSKFNINKKCTNKKSTEIIKKDYQEKKAKNQKK